MEKRVQYSVVGTVATLTKTAFQLMGDVEGRELPHLQAIEIQLQRPGQSFPANTSDHEATAFLTTDLDIAYDSGDPVGVHRQEIIPGSVFTFSAGYTTAVGFAIYPPDFGHRERILIEPVVLPTVDIALGWESTVGSNGTVINLRLVYEVKKVSSEKYFEAYRRFFG